MSFSHPVTVVKKQPLPTQLRYTASLRTSEPQYSYLKNLKKTTRYEWLNKQRPQEPKNHIKININSCSSHQNRRKQDNYNTKPNNNYGYNNNVLRQISRVSNNSDGLMTMSIPSSSSSSTSSFNTSSNLSFSNSSNSSSSFKKQTRKFVNTTNLRQTRNILPSNMMPSVTSRLKKNISRTKEKILQGIGKTDRTSDQNFDLYVENFERQHSQANKLTKELNRYLNCLKETQKASKTFYDTLRETYEPTWSDQAAFGDEVNKIEDKWSDYINKLVNDVQMPLISYLNEFPELKKKIDKRDNRLLDYDNARHTLEGVQNKNVKKGGTGTLGSGTNPLGIGATNSMTSSSTTEQLTKLTKLKIDLEDKQHVYEDINQTLCMALPVLYENRIKFYSSIFQTFFYTETVFHSDLVEIKSKLDTLCENLSMQTTDQVTQVMNDEAYNSEVVQKNNEINASGSNENKESPTLSGVDTNLQISDNQEVMSPTSEISTLNERQRNSHLPPNIGYIESSTNNELNYVEYPDNTNLNKEKSDNRSKSNSGPSTPLEFDSSKLESLEKFLDKSLKHLDLSPIMHKQEPIKVVNTNENTSGNNELVSNVSQESFLSKTLYKVKATYSYEAKELDELTFVKEDIIDVVEGTESENEDLDEGWLIGIHEASHKRGLFPENFTKKI